MCGEVFESKSLLRHHYITVHSTEDKPFICISCGKGFRGKANYLAHCETHKRTKREYKCETCLTVFNSCGELNQHKCVRKALKPATVGSKNCKVYAYLRYLAWSCTESNNHVKDWVVRQIPVALSFVNDI